jgi:hypothetical protein
MTNQERATLRDLFDEISGLRDRMDERFDGIEVRMRTVEADLNTYRGVEQERRERKVGLRWGVTTILQVAGLSAAVGGTVTAIILRFVH